MSRVRECVALLLQGRDQGPGILTSTVCTARTEPHLAAFILPNAGGTNQNYPGLTAQVGLLDTGFRAQALVCVDAPAHDHQCINRNEPDIASRPARATKSGTRV